MKQPQIILYGHFGVGNVGNDTTLEAMLYNLKRLRPDAVVTVVCSGPHAVAERFGVATLPIDVNEDRDSRSAEARPNRFVRLATRGVDEMDFWVRRSYWFRTVEQFIVVGTGALDDMAVPHPWNMPYDLFKWCRAARLGGARLVFLSVGAGPIVHPLSRKLMLDGLRLAHYRSYRDRASLEYLQSVGFDTSRDHLYPDLVFSLPEKASVAPDRAPGAKLQVGLGVIGYYGWRHDPQAGAPLYHDYIVKLKELVYWIMEQGHSIRMLTGDLPTDQGPLDEVRNFVRDYGPPEWQARLIVEPTPTVDALYAQLAQTDLVVATRFHNVLGALTLGRPVISIGYHRKNDDLMAEMGQAAYCQYIEQMDVSKLIAQFQALAAELPAASARIQARCAEFRHLLDEQYDRVLYADRQSAPSDSAGAARTPAKEPASQPVEEVRG